MRAAQRAKRSLHKWWARRGLLLQQEEEWRWPLAVVGFCLALAALHFLSVRMEARGHMQAFVASLGGASSAEYCPDYLPIIREALAPYYWPEDAAATGRGTQQRATGAPLLPEEVAKVEAFLEAIGGFRFSLHHGGKLATQPQGSRVHRKRLADFKANVALAQQAFGPLPDLDGWVVWGDAPTLSHADHKLEGVRLPPIGFSTTTRHYDVTMPYVTQAAWGEERELTRLAALVQAHPWEQKVARAVWRGSPTGNTGINGERLWEIPRARLVNMSLAHPDLLDARLAGCKQCVGEMARRYEAAGYGYSPFFSYEQQFDFQALVDVDGNSWSSRFPQLLSINSAVFKQETPFHEFFRPLLKPSVHYIPVSESLADLPGLLHEYLSPSSNRSAELKAVAAESTRFYIRHLTPGKQLCYFHLLLKEMGAIHAQILQARAGADVMD